VYTRVGEAYREVYTRVWEALGSLSMVITRVWEALGSLSTVINPGMGGSREPLNGGYTRVWEALGSLSMVVIPGLMRLSGASLRR